MMFYVRHRDGSYERTSNPPQGVDMIRLKGDSNDEYAINEFKARFSSGDY